MSEARAPAAAAFPLFEFIRPEHPFAEAVAGFRRRLAELPGGSGTGRTTIHAEIKALREGAGFRLDRFYWSLQRWPAGQSYRARTLSYAAKDGETVWYEFPADSYLTTMAGWFGAASAAAQVLRYVPLRRLTFAGGDARGTPAIGKFKRRSRYAEAWRLLGAVHEAVAARKPGFAVSRPLALDAANCLYFQTRLPGVNLADTLEAQNCAERMARLGALHRALHGLQVAAAPAAAADAPLATARADVAWIAFMAPEHAGVVGRALAALEAGAAAALDAAPVFCHGDFVCSQILAADAGWAVTDFDLCHRGSRYRDMAILLASLPYDVPAFAADPQLQAAAEQAYLAGYGDERLRLDARQLAWHRLAAEIYYLGLMYKKDQHAPAMAARRLALIGRLAGECGDGR
jgi:aminoglycoside phosphotransferase